MKPKILLEGITINQMPLNEQEAIWRLSKSYDVFEKDVNGVYWQILDLSGGALGEEMKVMAVRHEEITR